MFQNFLEHISKLTGKILFLHGSNGIKQHRQEILNALSQKDLLEITVTSNPDIKDLIDLYMQAKTFKPDCIIAAGGGSVIDASKILKAVILSDITSQEEMRKIIKNSAYEPDNSIKLIALPTTSGTGAEVTSWATVWDKELSAKYSVQHKNLYPNVAYIDPCLTYSMPLSLSASCMMDALAHAAESYWAVSSSPLSREFSLSAIKIISNNAEKFVLTNDDSSKYKISMASLLAGYAFSQTRTTLCHAISYQLTLKYNIPHGIAACLSLADVMLLNQESIPDSKEFFGAFGLSEPQSIKSWIAEILKKAGYGEALSDYGVRREEISDLAKNCFVPGRTDNNPVKVCLEDIENILLKML